MESPAYLDNRTCKRCGRFDILCTCEVLKPCPTCAHDQLCEDGTYVKCPVCVHDPITDMKLQGRWITERSG